MRTLKLLQKSLLQIQPFRTVRSFSSGGGGQRGQCKQINPALPPPPFRIPPPPPSRSLRDNIFRPFSVLSLFAERHSGIIREKQRSLSRIYIIWEWLALRPWSGTLKWSRNSLIITLRERWSSQKQLMIVAVARAARSPQEFYWCSKLWGLRSKLISYTIDGLTRAELKLFRQNIRMRGILIYSHRE